MRSMRYHVKIMTSGYIYIMLTVAISVAALNTGNNLLYLLSSLMLALMILSGLCSLGNLFFLGVHLDPPKAVYAGTPAKFTLHIKKRWGGSLFLSCETPFGGADLSFVQGEREVPLWLTFPDRGPARIEGMRIHSGFPMGFFRRFRVCPVALDLLIYPKPTHQHMPMLSGELHGESRHPLTQGEMGDEIKEIRSYRETDPLKWVDWKATARRGEIMVKDFLRLQGNTLIIDITRGRQDLERRLSEACYLVLEGDRRGLVTGLVLPDDIIEPGKGAAHRAALLEALARV